VESSAFRHSGTMPSRILVPHPSATFAGARVQLRIGTARSRFDPILVLAVVPVRIYRESLARLLEESVGVQLLGTVPSLRDDGANGFSVQPDIVLLDCGDPDCFRTAGISLRSFSGTKLLAIGGNDSDEQMDACAEAGICGHVAAGASFKELIGDHPRHRPRRHTVFTWDCRSAR
jgi:hypothetical protein